MKKLFCIEGETSSGKDSFVRRIVDEDERYSSVVSYTTRPKRDNEVDGVDHYFVSNDEFHIIYENNKSNVIAYTKICSKESPDGYEYMALKNEVLKHNIYIIDPNGIKYLQENFPDIEIVRIYIYTPLEERRERARRIRSDFEKEFEKRVKNEQSQFDRMRKNKDYDHMVVNLDHMFDAAYQYFKDIIDMELEKGKCNEK